MIEENASQFLGVVVAGSVDRGVEVFVGTDVEFASLCAFGTRSFRYVTPSW